MTHVKNLVVDDEKDSRDVIKLQLEQENCQFVEAENGEEAINTLRSENNMNNIHAILCDIRMPKMNGLECIDLINTEAPEIPVVVVTGYPDEELRATVMRKGVKVYLVKPVERQTMVDTFNNLVSYCRWPNESGPMGVFC